jgi:hypothetical protein
MLIMIYCHKEDDTVLSFFNETLVKSSKDVLLLLLLLFM